MYPYRRRGLPWLRISLIGLIVIVVLFAAFLFSLPRVEAMSPQGSHISNRAPIHLTFTTEMDPATVEGRLHISPAITGDFQWQDRTLTFVPNADWPSGPVQVTLDPGATARNGLPMALGGSWQFTVGEPGIAFLMPVAGAANLFSLSITGVGDPVPLTQERFGIDRFAVSADGTQFAYAALRADGGADLKRLGRDDGQLTDLLLCPTDRCTAPVFSRDGARLAFERHPLGHLEQSTVEVLNLQTSQVTALDSDPTHLDQAPTFAPDGRLAYLSFFNQVMVIHDFNTNTTSQIPNTSGEMGTWSPDGQYLLFPQITSEPPPTPLPGTPAPTLQVDAFFSHLTQVVVGTGQGTNLSGAGAVEDAAPVYSPTGSAIVFGRKSLVQDQWTPGRQMWVMQADGNGAHSLTDDPLFNNSNFVWSPDGKSLVYVRFDVTDASSAPEIWSVSISGANATLFVKGGYLPQWLP